MFSSDETRDPPPNPEFSKAGNKLWDMKMFLTTAVKTAEQPGCSKSYDRNDDYYSYQDDSYDDTPTPSPRSGRYSGSYSDNAPGSFTIFKYVLFSLLILSPCLRFVHLWWANGGRIRLRRSNEEPNHVVGLQYIPPMEHWFGAAEPGEPPRPHQPLTYQQVMNLPEIIYRKPVHFDDDEREVGGNVNNKNNEDEDHGRHVYNEVDDRSEDSNACTETAGDVDAPSENLGLSTTAIILSATSSNVTTTTPNTANATDDQSIGGEIGIDESFESGISFENEASTRLRLPTSPEIVLSNISENEPPSPRAIIPKEELPLDEERPEEQQQSQQDTIHLSFRTQRRLRNFTTTTCTTCSICIDEFEEGETIRLLPFCGHAFHTLCILPWLKDRQGCCPLCKTGVLDNEAAVVTNTSPVLDNGEAVVTNTPTQYWTVLDNGEAVLTNTNPVLDNGEAVVTNTNPVLS